ncbi:testis-expressed protein 9 isoform X3 [Rhipicephalus microplus]|uniref:testis-expressed protein 9 isoform X3 n=1 Tax=Rhipicephalus microplus TaxID=6941 RepID=UPI003F6D4EFD
MGDELLQLLRGANCVQVCDVNQRMVQKEKAMAELLEKNQQLEKQKADLLALIKKQMKLIDILKKQKIHLESTRIIQFTEDELIHVFGIDKKDQNL